MLQTLGRPKFLLQRMTVCYKPPVVCFKAKEPFRLVLYLYLL